MRLLCSSTSLAFVHTLRIALEGEDIATHCSDADMMLAGIAGPLTSGAARLYVLHDEDWERAVAVMQELSPPKAAPEAAAPAQAGLSKWLVMTGGVAIAAVLAVVLGS